MDKSEENQLNIKAKIELVKIINLVSSKFIVNIMYGRLLRIMTSYSKSTGESINMVNIGFDLGKDLINKYHYTLYLRDKKESADNLRFSVWMSVNKDKLDLADELDDNTSLFNIGSILVEWMISPPKVSCY